MLPMFGGEFLQEVYLRLRKHFGYAPHWWPGSPGEIFVTAILVQQCDWSQAWNASQRLKNAGLLHLPHLARAQAEDVEALIRPVAFSPTKSKRLVAIAEHLVRQGFDSVEGFLAGERGMMTVRRELLSLDGIGEETADSILLYASEHAVFVIDAYTRRVFSRLGAEPHRAHDFWRKSSYAQLQHYFQSTLEEMLLRFETIGWNPHVPLKVAVFRDYHAQIVEVAKHHCLRTKPRCHTTGVSGWESYFFCENHCLPAECLACPLAGLCPSGKEGIL